MLYGRLFVGRPPPLPLRLTVREDYAASLLGFKSAQEFIHRAVSFQAVAGLEDAIWIVLYPTAIVSFYCRSTLSGSELLWHTCS